MIGVLLAPVTHTVTSALQVLELSQGAHFQNNNWVLKSAVWPTLTAVRNLLGLCVAAFAATEVLVMGLDDPIERRRSEKIKANDI